MRAMIRRAFPNLVLHPGARRSDRSPQRFAWDGPRLTLLKEEESAEVIFFR
jgi:hypothetical protein